MPRTYEPIASQTLANSTTATVTFSSLSGNYTDLVCLMSLRTTTGTFNFSGYAWWRANSDSGTNYSYTALYSRSSAGSWSALSTRESNLTYGIIGAVVDPSTNSDIFAPVTLHLMSYANTNVNKTALSTSGFSSNLTNHDGPRRDVSLWRSTSAITSLTFGLVNGNFVSGSTISIFGVRAA